MSWYGGPEDRSPRRHSHLCSGTRDHRAEPCTWRSLTEGQGQRPPSQRAGVSHAQRYSASGGRGRTIRDPSEMIRVIALTGCWGSEVVSLRKSDALSHKSTFFSQSSSLGLNRQIAAVTTASVRGRKLCCGTNSIGGRRNDQRALTVSTSLPIRSSLAISVKTAPPIFMRLPKSVRSQTSNPC